MGPSLGTNATPPPQKAAAWEIVEFFSQVGEVLGRWGSSLLHTIQAQTVHGRLGIGSRDTF